MPPASVRLAFILSAFIVSVPGAADAHVQARPESRVPVAPPAADPVIARNDHHDRGRHDKGLHKGWHKGKGHHRDHGRSLEMRGPVVVVPAPPRPPVPSLPRLPSPPLDPRDLPRPPTPPLPRP